MLLRCIGVRKYKAYTKLLDTCLVNNITDPQQLNADSQQFLRDSAEGCCSFADVKQLGNLCPNLFHAPCGPLKMTAASAKGGKKLWIARADDGYAALTYLARLLVYARVDAEMFLPSPQLDGGNARQRHARPPVPAVSH